MRVGDAEDSIYEGLRKLPWPRYLAAMWILCRDLQTAYAGELDTVEDSALVSTVDLMQEVAVSGGSADAARRATELSDAWHQIRSHREKGASAGRVNLWSTLEGVAQEIASMVPQYEGAEWVTNAATERYREIRHNRRHIVVDPDEIIDDASPRAKLLKRFQFVVAEVTRLQEADWEAYLKLSLNK